jgi:hypothetical protein
MDPVRKSRNGQNTGLEDYGSTFAEPIEGGALVRLDMPVKV